MSACCFPTINHDKSLTCIQFILSLLSHKSPLIIGVNGAQGAGKSSLVIRLAHILSEEYALETLVLSLDDFYLTHDEQLTLAQSNSSNKLMQCRGQPGTHDIPLAREVFSALYKGNQCKIPAYDKSAHHGNGDRLPETYWKVVNKPGEKRLQVVIFEGWCVGFSSLSHAEVEEKRNQSSSKSLLKHELDHLIDINDNLKEYEAFCNYFNGFIHIDAHDLNWAYEWREEQEEKLRQQKGRGNAMSPQQVVEFVGNYFPAYELFTEKLRQGLIGGDPRREIERLRLIIGRERQILEIVKYFKYS